MSIGRAEASAIVKLFFGTRDLGAKMAFAKKGDVEGLRVRPGYDNAEKSIPAALRQEGCCCGEKNPGVVPSFLDVTAEAGLLGDAQKVSTKFGGPTIADLDLDGFPDLILNNHHLAPPQIWFNQRNGTFIEEEFMGLADVHGIVPGPYSLEKRDVRIVVSVGGSNGFNLRPPKLFQVDPETRKITDVSNETGITEWGTRGRTACFINLSGEEEGGKYLDDILSFNAVADKFPELPQHFAFEVVEGQTKMIPRLLEGFDQRNNHRGLLVTDLNQDGRMEIITWTTFTVLEMTGAFQFANITSQVSEVGLMGAVQAVAEVDFDNDGDFDLYIARGRLPWQHEGTDQRDRLLENRDGVLVDVTKELGIPAPPRQNNRGVTTGDFNNDGYVDIVVFPLDEQPYLLLNQGNCSFTTVEAPISRDGSIAGDNGVAVDLDNDGKLDIVESQGDHNQIERGGVHRIWKNVSDLKDGGHYLLVHVGFPLDGSGTNLHAVVSVMAGGKRMVRRVASPGAASMQSYIDKVHFGLGGAEVVELVRVVYVSGYAEEKRDVAVDTTVQLGWF
eukprot:CAMPEP_0198315666 /NCGR_PEP_ID=MMETSP1450-20131203/5858_1 /TAXON_ID=753684 ORGANISM="Madagascaria erythrocladiodes, Strain CCMP3234" /NCGR_SAMPLE_ID=MMETSP1450 /ASSEMBLY_ACC=CAM_ASM_001115 /LENGTH=557 /DNA_ID=CAMNT_0044018791 /DNA_START=383 /DNA_END=2058 /DNA_ORIENTATION=-